MRLYKHVYTYDPVVDNDAQEFRAVTRLYWIGIIVVNPKSLDRGGAFKAYLLSMRSKSTTTRHEQWP